MDEIPLSHSFENNLNQVLHQRPGGQSKNVKNKTIFDVKEIESNSSNGASIQFDRGNSQNKAKSINYRGRSSSRRDGIILDVGRPDITNSQLYSQDKSPQIQIQYMDSQAENLSSDGDQNKIPAPRSQ